MRDSFEQMLEEFLCPLSQLKNRVTDSLYFFRKDGSFVFSEGYCHPEGGLYGKIIYYPSPEGEVDIFGRRYGCTTKKMVDGEMIYVSHPEQIEMHARVDPRLDPASPRPVFVEYEMEFPLDDFVGYFEPRHSLQSCVSRYPWIKEGARTAGAVLEIPWKRLGITGSLAYGRFEEGDDDLDLVIQGTREENMSVYRKIRQLSSLPERMVVEFGRWWPMRFYLDEVLVCPFFIYDRWESAPLRDFRVKVLKEDVAVEGVVADDTHTIYMPPLLKLEDVKLAQENVSSLPLIIYDGALRGEFFQGDIVRMNARLVEVSQNGQAYRAALVTLWDNIRKIGETYLGFSG